MHITRISNLCSHHALISTSPALFYLKQPSRSRFNCPNAYRTSLPSRLLPILSWLLLILIVRTSSHIVLVLVQIWFSSKLKMGWNIPNLLSTIYLICRLLKVFAPRLQNSPGHWDGTAWSAWFLYQLWPPRFPTRSINSCKRVCHVFRLRLPLSLACPRHPVPVGRSRCLPRGTGIPRGRFEEGVGAWRNSRQH